MREVSKNIIAALALLSIIISAATTWMVTNAANGLVLGSSVPVNSQSAIASGKVSVTVNGTGPQTEELAGRVAVYVRGIDDDSMNIKVDNGGLK